MGCAQCEVLHLEIKYYSLNLIPKHFKGVSASVIFG